MENSSKHKNLFAVNDSCTICATIINEVTEVSDATLAALKRDGVADIGSVHIHVFGKRHDVVCQYCWERIRNG